MSALEQALQQCAILYGKDTSHNEKQSADEWLKKFTHESEAWTVAPQLLSGDFDEQTFFYGALVLRQKVIPMFSNRNGLNICVNCRFVQTNYMLILLVERNKIIVFCVTVFFFSIFEKNYNVLT